MSTMDNAVSSLSRQWLMRRLTLVQAAQDNPDLQALLMLWCKRDVRFWFRHFCWTFDPRLDQPHQPFVPYPFQEKALMELVSAIENGEDLLIEKSRDMGLSWLVLLAFQYFWLFRDGANFHLGSRKQEAVDRKGDLSTLMEKLRYNLAWLPHWMRLSGFQDNVHDNLLRLLNPANGNTITGESSNENFGRGGRYKAVLFDEFPFWPMQDAAYASAGQSTPSRIVVGTPYGKNNRFADLRFSGQVRILRIHWREHPLRDESWYAIQQKRMSEDEVARELDINYHLSLKDRVFQNFDESNKGDFQAFKPQKLIRSWDFGFHCPSCLFLAFDSEDRLLVLREVVGKQELLTDFAKRVTHLTEADYGQVPVEDICDPAGAQRSDKSLQTSIDILNSLGVFPFFDRASIKDGLELLRVKLSEWVGLRPALQVDFRCEKLIEAFEGGYRYGPSGSESPLQEHPYEDVMDCLRYAVMQKCRLPRKPVKKARSYYPGNRYTGY
jgi:hypothetical protein